MDANENDELYPIAVLIDELKVRLWTSFRIWLLLLEMRARGIKQNFDIKRKEKDEIRTFQIRVWMLISPFLCLFMFTGRRRCSQTQCYPSPVHHCSCFGARAHERWIGAILGRYASLLSLKYVFYKRRKKSRKAWTETNHSLVTWVNRLRRRWRWGSDGLVWRTWSLRGIRRWTGVRTRPAFSAREPRGHWRAVGQREGKNIFPSI